MPFPLIVLEAMRGHLSGRCKLLLQFQKTSHLLNPFFYSYETVHLSLFANLQTQISHLLVTNGQVEIWLEALIIHNPLIIN